MDIDQLDSATFGNAARIDVIWGGDKVAISRQQFVIARMGRIAYAVDINTGAESTRPQLIAKYRNVGARFEVISTLEQAYANPCRV